MKAYAIAAETIKDQAMFDTYRKVVPETLDLTDISRQARACPL